MDTTRPSLLLRIRDASDEASWHTFHGIYRPILMRFARARGLSMEDAEDSTQHVLAIIQDKIREFDYDPQLGRFKAWLRTLVHHHVLNMLRSRKTGQRHEAAVAEAAIERARIATPEEVFDRLWMQEHLWHCLKELRGDVEEQTLEIFRRVVFEEQPVRQVAEAFQVSAQNVYTIKWRLTRRIAEKMEALVGEELDDD